MVDPDLMLQLHQLLTRICVMQLKLKLEAMSEVVAYRHNSTRNSVLFRGCWGQALVQPWQALCWDEKLDSLASASYSLCSWHTQWKRMVPGKAE